MASSGTTSGLLRCPKNLKECIDWVLRATGKDLKGQSDIDKLNKALEAVLEESGLTVELDQLNALASGLGFLAGLPACLCKTKKSVEEGLKKIYEELNKNISLISCSNSKLNCDLCDSKLYPCKCCVIQSINKVKECGCIKNPSNKTSCHCDGKKVSCAKVLAGLEACLHLQCLQADMEDICQCNDPEKCCQNGKCTQASGGSGGKSCDFCQKLQSVPTTGLGLSPPNPIRLAKRLEKFFGGKSSFETPCDCSCKGSTSIFSSSCCCLSCGTGKCLKSCSCNNSGCSCDKAPKDCPRQTFCSKINSIKIPAQSTERTCCEGGQKCHCEVDKKCQATSSSGQGLKCCIEKDSKNNYKHSVKCLIRRLVSYFKSLQPSSDPSKENFKNCCELLCVIKTCHFLNNTLKDTSKGDGQTFYNALKELRLGGPCGQELWRTLDSFLNFIRFVFLPKVKPLENKIKEARDSCSNCQTNSKSGQHSSCSGCSSGTSGTSCEGCKAVLEELKKLKGHKDVLSLMTRGYSSAYDSKASWTSLTSSGSGSKCCGSLSSCSSCLSCSSTSPCDPSKCCPDCPQKKAAKIFLGMLPCLYYGLKILYERCKYNSGFAGWNLAKIPEASGLKDFLSAWGFESSHLSSKNASGLPPVLDILYGSSESKGSFDKIYDFVSQKYFVPSLVSSSKSDPKPPSTVRSMLLWLYGLRFHKHFSDLVSHCSSLCLPFGNSFHPDAFCYYIHVSCFLLPVSFISVIQCPDGSPSFLPSPSDWTSFSYPSDTLELFENFCDFVRKVFVALNFLYFQCKNDRNSAGWQYCWYGKDCIVKPLSSGSVSSSSSGSCSSCKYSGAYLCTAINKDTVHDHCQKGSCLGFSGSTSCNPSGVHPQSNGKTCTPCPHPLQRFLCHSDSNSNSNSQDYPFGLSDIVPMGFSKNYLPTPGKSGNSLYYVLKVFCESGFYPLTRLVEFALCISRYPPETFLELFVFFKKFAEALNSEPLKDHFVQWINGEPGSYPGRALKDAVQGLYGSKESHSGSTSHRTADLFSLFGCDGPKPSSGSPPTCGKYLFPLYNVDGLFAPELCDLYLSIVCHYAPKFKKEFESFYTAAKENFKCCLSSSSGSPCPSIVSCPCALPFLYRHGFSFWSPKGLSCPGHSKHNGTSKDCTQKSCSDFVTQLRLVAEGKPFEALLTVIDNFIWSIRLPFVYAFLYIWILVISYFYYVQFYKLDLLHIDSHLHLPRSFKILPSTLFSDASSKLKDLSYFTL
ncbi:variant erythrocyte surface antigen-1 family protein [Babesia divergens]|uniref:Variant erythrocyte surface antigen-1 family protein n=1 Tax=Babesia divergens TaxID=32595 RepID=A0AAD9LHD8_BABDI|nr:variant erythrocyte surface antigen-1 family protein [Babesia divergens]